MGPGGTKEEVAALPRVTWGDGTDKEAPRNMFTKARKNETMQGEGNST